MSALDTLFARPTGHEDTPPRTTAATTPADGTPINRDVEAAPTDGRTGEVPR